MAVEAAEMIASQFSILSHAISGAKINKYLRVNVFVIAVFS